MHRNRLLLRVVVLPLLVLASACMDISPPTAQLDGTDALLQRIQLPFERAVYGVDGRDSLGLQANLADGTPYEVDPAQVHWSIVPLTAALTIDSVGRIHVNTYSSQKFSVIASYTIGKITRADTGTIYITQESYEIETFRMTALDSASAGPAMNALLLASGAITTPKFQIEILDRDGGTIQDAPPYNNILRPTMSDFVTGLRVPELVQPLYTSLTGGQFLNWAMPEGKYWLHISTYLYGKHFADSIVFVSLPPAVGMLSFTNTDGQLEASSVTRYVQPCALLGVQNQTNDTIVLEVSKTVAERQCGGVSPDLTGWVIPPSTTRGIAALGYQAGQTITWTARTQGSTPATMSGTIFIKDSER